MKIYKMMIRPVITYWSQAWNLTAEDENNQRIFERQIWRKIFGPVNIDSVWRIRNNMEINRLIEGADIVRFIKVQRIKWLGHIQRMDQTRPARKLLDWKPDQQEEQDNDGKKMSWKIWKSWKLKTGRRQLRIEELGETWLRRRKLTMGCSAKWWWWWWWCIPVDTE